MNRKDEHLSLAKAFHKEQRNSLDDIRIIHRSIVDLDWQEIDISTKILGKKLATPFFINAMTGGSQKTKEVNRQLAIIARENDLMLATGSVSAALKDPSTAASFQVVRKEYPDGLLLANVGAGTTLAKAREALALFDADALQIHLNVPQELVMPEGDRTFRSWSAQLAEIIENLERPVIIKEVGFGMTRELIQHLLDLGAQTIDISGRGGTSFTQIENARRKKRELGYLNDWGQTTAESLLEANEVPFSKEIIASGGIRGSFDIFKALCLGADAVGVSGTILNSLLTDGVEQTSRLIAAWKEELHRLYLMTGAKSTAELATVPFMISGQTKDWCQARNIELAKYSMR